MTLATYRARQIVKERWAAKGHRLAEVLPRDVAEWADAEIKANPQILADALATVRNDPKLRTLAERQARWAKRLRR
jgi:hypothetical protein